MIQLLYLATSIVPILMMYVVYGLAKLLPSFFVNGFTCKNTLLACNSIVANREILYLIESCLFISLIGTFFCGWKCWKAEREPFDYDSVSNLNNEALNFFLALALGLITSDSLNYAWLGTLFVFLIVLSWRLNDYKVNLLLWFLGFRQYCISQKGGAEHTLITRSTLKEQKGLVTIIRLSNNLLMEI